MKDVCKIVQGTKAPMSGLIAVLMAAEVLATAPLRQAVRGGQCLVHLHASLWVTWV